MCFKAHLSQTFHFRFFHQKGAPGPVKKIIPFWIFEIIWAILRNSRNESVHILRTYGMDLFVHWEHAECICTYTEHTRKKVNLWMEFCYVYVLKTQNESVGILRICRMNLFVYWEYVERICVCSENTWNAQKVKYLGKFTTKILIQLRMFFGSPDGFVWPNHLKSKNFMQVYLGLGDLCKKYKHVRHIFSIYRWETCVRVCLRVP